MGILLISVLCFKEAHTKNAQTASCRGTHGQTDAARVAWEYSHGMHASRGVKEAGVKPRPQYSTITEVRTLCMAARQGPKILFFMSNRTRRILFIQ
jgi:hypothetical protein